MKDPLCEKIKYLYIEKDLSHSEVSEILNISKASFSKILKKHGISKRDILKKRKLNKIKELLRENPDADNLTLSKELDCSAGLISAYRKELGEQTRVSKIRKTLTRDYLIEQFLGKNLSANMIAKNLNISVTTVVAYIEKFNIKKEKKALEEGRLSRRIETMNDVYGADHPFQSPAIREKISKTNIQKYGCKNPMSNISIQEKFRTTMMQRYGCNYSVQSSELLNKIIESRVSNGPYYDDNLGSVSEIRKEFNIPENILREWFKEFSSEELNSLILSYHPQMSSLEIQASNLLDLQFFNKKSHEKIRYRPDFKIKKGVYLNVDGLYWHSEKHLNKRYHFDMRKAYEELGLRIFQFRGDEVRNKGEIIKSIVKNNLGNSERLYARKTNLRKVSSSDAKTFLLENHMMGYIKSRHIGLYHDNNLKMIFSYRKIKEGIKVDRFCSKLGINVVGGFSKLMKYVERSEEFKYIDYWVDLRYGTGNYLKKLGFIHKKDTLGWKWTDGKNTYNRLRCRANMDDRKLSQKEYAEELGWYKIYDAGQRLYRKEIGD